MTDGTTREDRQFFADQGYLVVRGLLDVANDIGSFKEGFGRLLNGMADIISDAGEMGSDGDSTVPSIASRLAVLLGSGGRCVLDHLEPTLSSRLRDWQWRPDFPSAQFPEWFWLMRNERLLGALENLLGPEITCSPSCHLNMKLGSRDRDKAASVAPVKGKRFDRHELSNFLVAGASDWHADGGSALPGSYRITAWIPITKATLETGCLRVVPGSHKDGPWHGPVDPSVTDRAVDVPADPGDIIFFDDWMLHGAGRNRSETQFRWAINFRYRRSNEPADVAHLPSVIVRSRETPENELRDPELWSQMWHHALRYAATKRPSLPYYCGVIDRAVADAVRAHWRAKISSPADWLRLDEVQEKPRNMGDRD